MVQLGWFSLVSYFHPIDNMVHLFYPFKGGFILRMKVVRKCILTYVIDWWLIPFVTILSTRKQNFKVISLNIFSLNMQIEYGTIYANWIINMQIRYWLYKLDTNLTALQSNLNGILDEWSLIMESSNFIAYLKFIQLYLLC